VNVNVATPGTSKTVALTGTVTTAAATVSPSSLAFGSQLLSTVSATQTVTVSNTGTGPLTITGISIGGVNYAQFVQSNNCPSTLNPGASCTVGVRFAPNWVPANPNMSATVNVNVATPGTAKTVALTGTVIQ